MAPTALVVLTTLATDADARTLVTALLPERLIACGTLLPGGRSMYRWEGEANEESEVAVLLKTDVSRWEALPPPPRPRGRRPRPRAPPGGQPRRARRPPGRPPSRAGARRLRRRGACGSGGGGAWRLPATTLQPCATSSARSGTIRCTQTPS